MLNCFPLFTAGMDTQKPGQILRSRHMPEVLTDKK